MFLTVEQTGSAELNAFDRALLKISGRGIPIPIFIGDIVFGTRFSFVDS